MTSASKLIRGLVVLATLGCTEPQSGIFATGWCKAADPQIEVLDDMEDGDGIPCSRTGKWSVEGAGATTPPLGPIARAVDLPAADWPARPSSFRAMHLAGTVDPDGIVKLVLPLASRDLSPFQEIDFWARTDAGTLQLRVAIKTATTTDDDPFVTGAEITPQWGEQGNPSQINNVALAAFSKAGGQALTPDERLSSLAIEFQLLAASNPSSAQFGFWIDDVQLKP